MWGETHCGIPMLDRFILYKSYEHMEIFRFLSNFFINFRTHTNTYTPQAKRLRHFQASWFLVWNIYLTQLKDRAALGLKKGFLLSAAFLSAVNNDDDDANISEDTDEGHDESDFGNEGDPATDDDQQTKRNLQQSRWSKLMQIKL